MADAREKHAWSHTSTLLYMLVTTAGYLQPEDKRELYRKIKQAGSRPAESADGAHPSLSIEDVAGAIL